MQTAAAVRIFTVIEEYGIIQQDSPGRLLGDQCRFSAAGFSVNPDRIPSVSGNKASFQIIPDIPLSRVIGFSQDLSFRQKFLRLIGQVRADHIPQFVLQRFFEIIQTGGGASLRIPVGAVVNDFSAGT